MVAALEADAARVGGEAIGAGGFCGGRQVGQLAVGGRDEEGGAMFAADDHFIAGGFGFFRCHHETVAEFRIALERGGGCVRPVAGEVGLACAVERRGIGSARALRAPPTWRQE